MIEQNEGWQRILVVEDNPNTLDIVKRALKRADYEVWTATDGQVALEVISRQGLPHLALVDINMPNMNGFEFLKYRQQEPGDG